jgi:hypothetical protein
MTATYLPHALGSQGRLEPAGQQAADGAQPLM